MNKWPWLARDKAGKQEQIKIEAVTYIDAKVRACRRFGFVDRTPHSDWPETWKVDVQVVPLGRETANREGEQR